MWTLWTASSRSGGGFNDSMQFNVASRVWWNLSKPPQSLVRPSRSNDPTYTTHQDTDQLFAPQWYWLLMAWMHMFLFQVDCAGNLVCRACIWADMLHAASKTMEGYNTTSVTTPAKDDHLMIGSMSMDVHTVGPIAPPKRVWLAQAINFNNRPS